MRLLGSHSSYTSLSLSLSLSLWLYNIMTLVTYCSLASLDTARCAHQFASNKQHTMVKNQTEKSDWIVISFKKSRSRKELSTTPCVLVSSPVCGSALM